MIKKYPQRKFAVINLSTYLPLKIRKRNIKNALSKKMSANRYFRYCKRKQQTASNIQRMRRRRGIKNLLPHKKFTAKKKKPKKDKQQKDDGKAK